MILPNTLIAGVPKSGTSSVHQWLADHPECVGSLEKETYFMVDPDTHMYRADRHIAQGIAGYAALFPQQAGAAKVVLESTPSYLYSKTALAAVSKFPVPPKVIFILREPSDQIFSLFRYFRDNWTWIPSDMSFAAFIAACDAGTQDFGGNELARNCLVNADYATHLAPWVAAVGRDRVKIVLFDDLNRDQSGVTRDIAKWLDLDDSFYDRYGFARENETYTPKSRRLQQINVAIRARLPNGAVYNGLRRLYRALNTTRPGNQSQDDASVRAGLRQRFAPSNRRLETAFDLNLSRWYD